MLRHPLLLVDEQINMSEIIKSKGTTESERYLAKIADKTFLNLWAYPNVFRDAVVNGRPAGKELCDLLVVCGDHIIIFSDKNVAWSKNKETDIAWQRWYRRAIKDSVNQLIGAEKWIIEHPERVFIDSSCAHKLPINIPPADCRKVHLVAVALGAHKACSKFFSGDTGSFIIRPSLKGDSHINKDAPEYAPFTIGDINPSGSFIHVMNDITLDIVMKELDTITDFTDYLEQKADFVRSGRLMSATGEEDLLAYYLEQVVGDRHGFAHPDNREWSEKDHLSVSGGMYYGLLNNPQYIEKIKADQISYFWDQLIRRFTDNMLNGTTIIPEGISREISDHEIGVRCMAHETRVMRRMLSQGILDVIKVSDSSDRHFRSFIPPLNKPGSGTGYAFMTLALPKIELAGGYEQYRKVRVNIMTTYCFGMLRKYSHVKRMVGIATESMGSQMKASGSSEDMVMVEQPSEWTPELNASLDKDLKSFDIIKEGEFTVSNHSVDEYPKIDSRMETPGRQDQKMNRHQRRAMEAKMRKRKV